MSKEKIIHQFWIKTQADEWQHWVLIQRKKGWWDLSPEYIHFLNGEEISGFICSKLNAKKEKIPKFICPVLNAKIEEISEFTCPVLNAKIFVYKTPKIFEGKKIANKYNTANYCPWAKTFEEIKKVRGKTKRAK